MAPESLRNLRHELRTPINHILGYAELLLEQATDLQRPDLVADLERIHAAGKQLLKPIADHLDAVQLEPTSTELVELSLELRTPLTTIVGYGDLLAEVAVGQVPAEFLADISRIRNAGIQLLSRVNATLVQFETHPDPAAGVDVYQSTSVACLPPPTAQPSAVSPSRLKGHLLVVDDDAANRDILSRRLMRLGCTVSCAENGRVALERLHYGGVDLVLLDVMMPELNGFDVLTLRREDAQLHQVARGACLWRSSRPPSATPQWPPPSLPTRGRPTARRATRQYEHLDPRLVRTHENGAASCEAAPTERRRILIRRYGCAPWYS